MKKIVFLFSMFCSCAYAQEFKTDAYHIVARSLVENFGQYLGATAVNQARPITSISLEMIKDFEGWQPMAYNDPVGYCTIGYGHLIALQRCENIQLGEFANRLTEEKGEDLLIRDLVPARLAVVQSVSGTVDLTDDQFSALASFTFNVGDSNFKNSTMLRLINEKEFEAAAGQFARWVRAKNRILPGLVIRRACSETLFRGHLEPDGNGRFNRSVCQSLGAAPTAGPLIDIDVGEL
ncbi:lysozyme [Rhizobium ruizarguesonis]